MKTICVSTNIFHQERDSKISFWFGLVIWTVSRKTAKVDASCRNLWTNLSHSDKLSWKKCTVYHFKKMLTQDTIKLIKTAQFEKKWKLKSTWSIAISLGYWDLSPSKVQFPISKFMKFIHEVWFVWSCMIYEQKCIAGFRAVFQVTRQSEVARALR